MLLLNESKLFEELAICKSVGIKAIFFVRVLRLKNYNTFWLVGEIITFTRTPIFSVF